jgi:hypothetical protein
MSSPIDNAEIKRRYHDLQLWADVYCSNIESRIQTATGWKRFHTFVMDQFEESYPEEHLTQDKAHVFLSLRVAIDLKDIDRAEALKIKDFVKSIKSSFQILAENYHDDAQVVDLDWHVSEKEKEGDGGEGFAAKVLADCRMIADHFDRVSERSTETELR